MDSLLLFIYSSIYFVFNISLYFPVVAHSGYKLCTRAVRGSHQPPPPPPPDGHGKQSGFRLETRGAAESVECDNKQQQAAIAGHFGLGFGGSTTTSLRAIVDSHNRYNYNH